MRCLIVSTRQMYAWPSGYGDEKYYVLIARFTEFSRQPEISDWQLVKEKDNLCLHLSSVYLLLK